MNRENENRFNRVQPNSTQRLEFLIVVDYLKKYAYDKDHATTQKEIVDYALNEYGECIRRDRVGQILIHMEQLSKTNPELLPFTLETVNLNKIKNYYVPQRMFNNDEIVKIISALYCDRKLSNKDVEALSKKFLDITANDYQQSQLLKRISKRGKTRERISDRDLTKQDLFLEAIDKQYHIYFRLKKPFGGADYSSRIDMNMRRQLANKEELISGYPAMTYLVDNELRPVIYMDRYQIALITTFDNIIIDRYYDISDWNNQPINMNLIGNYQSIDEWLEDHYKGKDGHQNRYVCKVTTNNEQFFNKFKKEYRDYWHEELKYEIKERIVPIKRVNSEGKEYIDEITAYDAHFVIESNYSSFKHWYGKLGNYDEVVIIEPKELNDMFLAEKIDRYAKRLTKYGLHYNYKIEKEMKPEYQALREERERRFVEFKKRRESKRLEASHVEVNDNKETNK